MRHHFLAAFVAIVLIGLVSGQIPLGNGFQSSSFASSSSGVQVSAGVNNFQSYNQAPPTNFNPNGRNGFTGTETDANSMGGVAINPVNPSNHFQQFPSLNVPVDSLSVPQVNAAASSSSFQQFPNSNVPGNPFRVPPVNSAAANSFHQFPNANAEVNPLRIPPVNAAVSSNSFQPFPNSNIPAGAVPSVDSAVLSNDFQHNPSPIVPDLPVNKPPVQSFPLTSSNEGQMGNRANYPPPQIANPSNSFSSAHSSASLSSGIPNDYPKFPFPKGFLDQLIASLGAVKSKSTAEDASETMAASLKDLNNGSNEEISNARKKNGNKRRNKKKSKARRKAESKAKAKSNSKTKVIQPATSKQDITTNASADEIKETITASDIVDRDSAAFVTSSIVLIKDSAAETKSKTSIPNIETTNVQDEEAKSTDTATSPTTQAILITNSEISNTDSEKTSNSSVTKSNDKDETRRITAVNTGVNILSTESPKKPNVKAKKFKNRSKRKHKNKNRKTKLSTSSYETTKKSTTNGSTLSSSSIQVAEVQRETTNAVDTTPETIDETTTTADAKANIMDSMVTRDFASSVIPKQEDITKVTESSFESDVQTSKSERMQNKSLDTQTNPIESISKVDEKLFSSTTTQSPKKKKSNRLGKRKNNSKKSNASSTKRKTVQVQKTSAPKDDTSNINLTESDNYAPTPSGATLLAQPQTSSKKKYVSSDLVNDYVTDATTQAFSSDFTITDSDDASKSETISNKRMSSIHKADSDSGESKFDEDSDTSKSVSNSEISYKTTTAFENQGIPNDYPKFPFPKEFLDELLKSLEADRKSKSTEEATSETPVVNENVNKENKKAKSKPRRKHGPRNRNSKRKSKADSKNTKKAKSDVDSHSVEKAMTISTASPESKLDNPKNAVVDAGEMISITTSSNTLDSFSVTESSNVQKETTETIDTTGIPTAQAVVTNLGLDDIDSDTSKTKNPKSPETGETKIITAASTAVSSSSTESPKKANVKSRKLKRKSKSKSKIKKNEKTKLSTNKYETTQKSTTKPSSLYSSSIQIEKSQGETTNSMDSETGEIDHTDTAESVTINEMDSVFPNDERSSATTKYQEEKIVTDTSNNKSDFITPKFGEKQMDSMVAHTSKGGNKLRLSTAAPRKHKNRNKARKSKNNRNSTSTSASKNTTPLQEQSSPNDDKIYKNPGDASEFMPSLSATALTTTSYKSTDKTKDKKNTPKSETTSDVEEKSSLFTETTPLKSEIGESDEASKSITDSAISSKTTVGLQNQDSDLISDSNIKTTSKMSELEIATTVEIENNDKEISSKISREKHTGKAKISKQKSKVKRKKKRKKELNSRRNKNEIMKTKTDTTSPHIDIPTTEVQIATIDSEHKTAFATDQSFLSTSSGDFTFPRDPNLANSEETPKQDETTTINIPFTDLNILTTKASNKSTMKALSPRKKSKHKKRKLKRKPTKSKSEAIQTSLDHSKYYPSSSDSQLANVRNQTALSIDTVTTTNDQIILRTNSKTKNSDSDLTGDSDTTTETIEVTTLCKTKAVGDNLNIAPKKSSKRARRLQNKKSQKSNSKRKSAVKHRLRQVASTDTPTKYSTSDAVKQTTAKETVAYSVSKLKRNPTKVNTQTFYTTPMNNEAIGDDFTGDPDLRTSPKSSEIDEITAKSPTINHTVSPTGFSKSLFRKFRKRKNKIKHKNENSTFVMKKSVPPHQKMQFISFDEATKETGHNVLTTKLSALSTTAKDAKNMRLSTTAYEKTFPGKKSNNWKKMVKKRHRRRKFPLRAKSKFVKTHSSSSTFSGSIRNPDDTISSTNSLPSTSDSTQEASSTQYLPVTITTTEEVETTTMLPIQNNVNTKGFKSKTLGKRNHYKRGNNIHKEFRRKNRLWKGKKKLPKRKNSRGDIIQPASNIYSDELDAVSSTRGFIAEADTITPTSHKTAETDEGNTDSSGETQNALEDTVLSEHKISTNVNNISNSEDTFSTIITEATVDTDRTEKGNTRVTEMKTIRTTKNEEISADKRMTAHKSKITPVEIEISTTMKTVTTTKEEDNTSETETSSDLDTATDEIETSITPNGLAESDEETNEEITSKESTTTKKDITASVTEITPPLNQIPVTEIKSTEREEKIIKTEEKSTEDKTTLTKEEITTSENAVTTSVEKALFTESIPSDTVQKTTEKETIATKKEITTPQIEEISNESKISVTTNGPIKAKEKIIGNEEETTEEESSTAKTAITTSHIEETSDENETSITTEQINVGEKIIKTEVTAGEETTTTENEFTTSRYKLTTTESEPSITTKESIKTQHKSTKIGEETANKEKITSKMENTTPVNEHTTAKESTALVKKTTEIVNKVDTTEYKGTEKATDKTTVVTHIKSIKGKVTKPINNIAATEPITMATPKSIAKEGKTTVERETYSVKMEADVTKEESTETSEIESTLHTTYSYPFDYATETPPPGVECRKNERYYKCVPHCRHTCFNYDNYVVPCPTFCMPGCFCDPGLVVDENGDCVNISQCKNYTCGEDEEWWYCKPQYHNTCANFARAEARLDFDCESGCFCRDGLIQDKDGSCVEIYDCSDPICEETEEATDCLNTCNTCEADCHACTITMCTQGCDCLAGYKRDANGTCIHASKCPVCTSPSPVSNSTE